MAFSQNGQGLPFAGLTFYQNFVFLAITFEPGMLDGQSIAPKTEDHSLVSTKNLSQKIGHLAFLVPRAR